jgi:hypothetical protein
MRSRLLIVDDHHGFLDAAPAGLEHDGTDVVGTATSSALGSRIASPPWADR